ncbi:MAG: adenylate/guanylate cyclase domain-containing protein [Verrucomicrobiales bacterium]
MKPYQTSKRFRIFDIGVPSGMPAFDAKHIRLCNAAALIASTAALAFFFWEIPLITDWGHTTRGEATLILARGLSVLPFLIPVWLNHRGRYDTARWCLVVWNCLLIVEMGWIFGGLAPSHLFLVILGFILPSLFPPGKEVHLLWATLLTVLTFTAFLILRTWHEPLVPVHRSGVRLAMELAVTGGCLILAFLAGKVVRDTTWRAECMAVYEKDRADRLLLNILPPSVATRLMDDPSTIADGFHEVTVLFADLVGFTPMAESLTPREIVQMMDDVFTRFDALVEAYGLEKIKTIGDAYMLAGGLPLPDPRHASKVAAIALDMQETIASIQCPDGQSLQLRIGIATGPVVAGVIGRKKFLYDLWGDTVNTASRLESSCLPGRIQVEATTREQLGTCFVLEERGMIQMKGKGELRTWFLNGKSEPN